MSDPLDVMAAALASEVHVDTAHGFPPRYGPLDLAQDVLRYLRFASADQRAALAAYLAAPQPEPSAGLRALGLTVEEIRHAIAVHDMHHPHLRFPDDHLTAEDAP